MPFPKDFVWGAAASSYQIEGATQGVDGCGESVWDMVCRRPGFVAGGDTGFTACDHYHRVTGDVALMKQIGLQAYRLSVMWPRVLPDGVGRVNEPGLAFYDRLVDQLLAAGIQPWVTLFHWDYPLALFHRGGWLHPDSPSWFAEYTQVLVDRLSDRVRHWFTLNEPACFIGLGHQVGEHAPGLQLPPREVNRAWHHALLAHGDAVQVIRSGSHVSAPMVGAAPCFHTFVPMTEDPADIAAARKQLFSVREPNMFQAAWSLEPLFAGRYPEDGLRLWGEAAPEINDGDLERIHQPLDFLGLNIYDSAQVRAGDDGEPEVVPYPADHPRTDMGWPVTPGSLRWASRFLHERYAKPIVITENGLASPDWIAPDGAVHDPNRITFLTGYLRGLEQSIDAGVPVAAYFQWSIMDNFEWAFGYGRRFGLIHVDYATGRRTLKDSAHWYRDLIDRNGAGL
ncbi:MAG: GH1 family beta-glucosidase [Opitutales bacterium]